MFGITLFGLFLWAILFIMALAICWLSTQPGQRRRKQEPTYDGPERRSDPTEKDFLDEPMFNRPHAQKVELLETTEVVIITNEKQ